ncbi:unnamed protein product [Larinioides sclopetarius]|uniref:Uncharacterized protein n=1 Tax=Larinioides sclopetarius TaxID=280406 RepID=A0AAV1ZV49_9ARAC
MSKSKIKVVFSHFILHKTKRLPFSWTSCAETVFDVILFADTRAPLFFEVVVSHGVTHVMRVGVPGLVN